MGSCGPIAAPDLHPSLPPSIHPSYIPTLTHLSLHPSILPSYPSLVFDVWASVLELLVLLSVFSHPLLPARWSLLQPLLLHLLCTSSHQPPVATSHLPASRSWSAHDPWLSTLQMWPRPPSPSAWDPVSQAPASTWRASFGRRQKTVRQHRASFRNVLS